MLAFEVYDGASLRERLAASGARADGMLELLTLLENAPALAEVRVMVEEVERRMEDVASGDRLRLDDDPATLAYHVLERAQHEADVDLEVQELLKEYLVEKEEEMKEKLENAADQLVEFATGGGHANMPYLRQLVRAMAEELFVF